MGKTVEENYENVFLYYLHFPFQAQIGNLGANAKQARSQKDQFFSWFKLAK